MKNKYVTYFLSVGIILAASTVAQADFEIKNTESKSISYSVYADDYDYDYEAGTDVVNEEGLKVDINLETTLKIDSQDPFLIFYHHSNVNEPGLYFGNKGSVKFSSYCDGFLDEYPSEEGRISEVYYLKSPEEAGLDISVELYVPEFSTYAKIEEKSGKSFLAAVQLTDKDKTAERTELVPVIEGKADKDLWWYLKEEDTDAEILGVLPLEEMPEGVCSVEVEPWSLRGEVVSEWSTYNSGASFNYTEPMYGIVVAGCEDNGESIYMPMSGSQWDYYNINKYLSDELQSKIGTEEEKALLEMAMKEIPQGDPTITLYGIAVPDEVVNISVSSAAEDSYGDILKNAPVASITLLDGSTYESYSDYLKATDPNAGVTEPETETVSEAVKESSEDATEAVTDATEAVTEASAEPDKVYTDAETIKQLQDLLRAMGYDPGVVDGKMGKKTVAAMQEFQADEGLEVSDKITESFMAAFVAKAETEMELNKKVQEKLVELGANLGTIDGRKGKKTVAAMNEFQKANGLEVTNKLTDELLDALGIEK